MSQYSANDRKLVEETLALLNTHRLHESTEETLTLLKELLEWIKMSPKLWREYTQEVVFAIQDIVRFCFEDNPKALNTIRICKEIFFLLRHEYNNANEGALPNVKEGGNDKYFYNGVKDNEHKEDISNKTSYNFADPSVLAAEFPLLSAPEKHENKEKGSTDMAIGEISFETVKKYYKDIVESYSRKWEVERGLNYPEAHIDVDIKQKLSSSLAIHESYIMKVLQEKWLLIEKNFKESCNLTETSQLLNSIYETLLGVQKNLNHAENRIPTDEDENNQMEKHEEIAGIKDLTINHKILDENNYLEENEPRLTNNMENLRCNPGTSPSAESILEIMVNESPLKVSSEDIPLTSNKSESQELKLEDIYINEHFVNAKESQNEIPTPNNFVDESSPKDEQTNRTNLMRSFEIEFKSGVANKPAERLISIDNNPESYIDLDRLWASNSRWISMKYKLLQKGIIKSNEFYTCLPIHRNEFVVASGTFGAIEIGFSKSFHAIAIRRLTEIGWSPERCEDMQKTTEQLYKVKHTNLLKSYVIQDYCGYMFFYTGLCDYNLDEYLAKMKETKQLNDSVAKRISFQIVKGLGALHTSNPTIVHGGLKPTNIFIDEDGVLKLAEFGIFKHAYKTNEIIPTKKRIWWPSECHMWYKFLKTYSCTLMSDIQACGILLHFVNSGGIHPYGRTNEEIIHNLEARSPNISVDSLELWALLNTMFHPDPCQRPSITEVVNHVYFWSDEKKWEFLKRCLAIANADYEPLIVSSSIARKFCQALEESWSNDATKFFWMASAFMHFPAVEIPYGAWTDSGLGLLKFLNKCRHEHPGLFNKTGWVLKAYPELPSLIYNALRGTQWFQREDLKKFNPLNESEEE